MATGGFDETVALWSREDGSQVARWKGLLANVFDLAFDPRGELLAAVLGDGTVWMVNLASLSEIRRLSSGPDVRRLAFSPDGTLLAACGKTIRMLSLGTGSLVREIDGHAASIQRVAFAPCGTLLVTLETDGALRTWRV